MSPFWCGHEAARIAQRDLRRRWTLFWLLVVGLTLGLAAVGHAQGITNEREPLIIWTPPPLIGMWTPDSERVNDALPMIASADWPDYTDTLTAELRACAKIHDPTPERPWPLRTVAAAHFMVAIRDGETMDTNTPFDGFTFTRAHRIYVAQWKARSRKLLKHELLHAMLYDHGIDPRHNTPVADGMFKRCFGK